MRIFIWTANILGWPVIQLGIARWMLSRSAEQFQRDNWITRERQCESNGSLYRRLFLIHRWKSHLPDGARCLGGVSQRSLLHSSDERGMLIGEMRRAELAHWYMILCTPIFFLWNPPWACSIMVAYGLGSNFPCMIAQRFNRSRLTRIVQPRRRGEEQVR